METLVKTYPQIIKTSLLIRKVEEKLLELFSQGHINGTVHTCVGQELIGPVLMPHLQKNDFIVSNHRGHGHYIARTGDVEGLIAEVMGREAGVCRGIGGSQHLLNHRYMSNGIQGGMAPVAAGVALASQLEGKDDIAVAFIGDGTLGEGLLYESFNLCGIWNLPVLFVLENNHYAQSTSDKQTFSGSVKERALGFGLKYLKADTWDVVQLSEMCKQATQLARDDKQPVLLEVETYRLNSHSKGDDNRDTTEVTKFQKQDILNQVLALNNTAVQNMLTECETQINAAVEKALKSPKLKELPHTLTSKNILPLEYASLPLSKSDKRLNEHLYDFFKTQFERDDKSVFLGEDIQHTTDWTPKAYGGAFKVSRDLSALFKGRVRNTPISEASIVGVGTGLALAGFKPVVEIMFGDFMLLTLDQIVNHATKFCSMYGQKLDVPLIVRTPMGGRRGYGPTHSQSFEKYFLGTPHLNIVALNARVDPNILYQQIYKNTEPTLVIENKVLYTQTLAPQGVTGFDMQISNQACPTLCIKPQGGAHADLTILCYGEMLSHVESAIQMAFDEEEIFCEIICPSQLQPFDTRPLIDSVTRTGRLLTVEEGSDIAGFGSEACAQIKAAGVNLKQFAKLGCQTIIPCAFEAEQNILPHAKMIFSKIKELLHD